MLSVSGELVSGRCSYRWEWSAFAHEGLPLSQGGGAAFLVGLAMDGGGFLVATLPSYQTRDRSDCGSAHVLVFILLHQLL